MGKREIKCKIQPVAAWKILIVDNGPTAPYSIESYVATQEGNKTIWRMIYQAQSSVYYEAVIIAGEYLASATRDQYRKAV